MSALKPVFAVLMLVAATILAVLSTISKPFAEAVARHMDFMADELLGRFSFFAVVAVKSTMVTNLDASPVVEAPAYQAHGRLREMVESVSIGSGDDIASIYRVFRVWSGWRVSELLIDSPDIGTTTIADVGLYKAAQHGGAVVDADFFASALSLKDGALAKTDITRENTATITIANADKRLWEQLGLTEDPKLWYDVALTLTAAADAAGEIGLRLKYVDGS